MIDADLEPKKCWVFCDGIRVSVNMRPVLCCKYIEFIPGQLTCWYVFVLIKYIIHSFRSFLFLYEW